VDLVFFEEENLKNGQVGANSKDKPRGVSCKPGERRLNGLEAVYLTKF